MYTHVYVLLKQEGVHMANWAMPSQIDIPHTVWIVRRSWDETKMPVYILRYGAVDPAVLWPAFSGTVVKLRNNR